MGSEDNGAGVYTNSDLANGNVHVDILSRLLNHKDNENETEVLGSDDDSSEDPLQNIMNIVRPKTFSDQVFDKSISSENDEISLIEYKVIRPSTEPIRRIKRSRKVNNKVDLLTILLPDNIDTSITQNDFSILHSTPLTDDYSSQRNKRRLIDAQSTSKNNNTVIEINRNSTSIANEEDDHDKSICDDKGVEVAYLLSEDIKHGEGEEPDIQEEGEQQEHIEDEDESEIDETVKESSTPEPEADMLKQKVEDSKEEEKEEKEERETHDNYEPTIHDKTTETKEKNTEGKNNETPSRPARRTSTLIKICSTNVPFRTGLSKRASVSHLHPYLKK